MEPSDGSDLHTRTLNGEHTGQHDSHPLTTSTASTPGSTACASTTRQGPLPWRVYEGGATAFGDDEHTVLAFYARVTATDDDRMRNVTSELWAERS